MMYTDSASMDTTTQVSETGIASTDLQRLHENLALDVAESSEQRYRSLFEDAPVAYHEIDINGVLTRINLAECALLGYKREEMLGRPVWDLVAAEERAASQEAVGKKVRGEKVLVPFERTYRTHDGRQVAVEIHESLIRDGAGEVIGIRSCLLNITDRKRAEAALHRQAAELARSNGELEQFAYVASHDLQEPLRKIQAFGDRLKTKYAGALPAEGADYLERMQNAANRMQTLINDLLTLSRVATNARPFVRVDLSDVARLVLSDLESRIEQLGAEVTVEPLPVVVAERLQMSQLLQNLIGNGLKFHKPGVPPLVTVKADLVRDPNGAAEDVWRVTVEDNGIGFDEKYCDRIFQVFQRLHGRNEYEGTGIGLAICRKITERHGGTIAAYSTPGAGSRFVVMLPKAGQEDTIN
jgi:two-component system, LuxR family, sensor kinase FixL